MACLLLQVDVPADGGQLRGERLDIRGVGIDDISVNRHLPKIGADPLCRELGHLLLNQRPFLRCHRATQDDGPLSV